MKAPSASRPLRAPVSREITELRARLVEAEETIQAIRRGEVDTVAAAGKEGRQVFTLQGAEHAYRMLIESMNEGALTLMTDQTILYANRCFATMVKCPLEQVMGGSFRRYLSPEDRATLRLLVKRADPSGAKIQMRLICADGSRFPAQISLRLLARSASSQMTMGMVVTDLAEAKNTEEMLRALTHRVVRAQEDERGRVALELHDHITQLLCAAGLHSHALAAKLAGRNAPLKREAIKLREMLGQAAGEVERISRNLRPSILEQLGLIAVLRETCTEFARRTGVRVDLSCAPLSARPPGDAELALYRILQEALQNVEKHARARVVTVGLRTEGGWVQLTVSDDGTGFDPDRRPVSRRRRGGIGLLSMRERAASVSGMLAIKSGRRGGTQIEARIPLAPDVRR